MPIDLGAQPDLEIEVRPEREWVCVAPAGELDLATVPALARAVHELRDVGFTAFKIDLRGLTFIDSTGLRLLLELARDDGIELRIVRGTGAVQRVFELAGVVDLLPLTGRP